MFQGESRRGPQSCVLIITVYSPGRLGSRTRVTNEQNRQLCWAANGLQPGLMTQRTMAELATIDNSTRRRGCIGGGPVSRDAGGVEVRGHRATLPPIADRRDDL